MEDVLVGIDVGTTFCKAAVVGLDGRERAHGRARTPWEAREGGGVETDPRALVEASLAAARAALAARPGRVLGIGVTSMAETGVLLDRRGRPVAPALAWHDPRGDEEASALRRELGDAFTDRTGLPATKLCSLCKYRWLRANVPAAAEGVRWLSVAEWIVRGLGGDELAELSLASRTGFLDVRAESWWADALGWAGAPAGLLPALAPAGTPAGRTDALEEARGAVLTVAGHDHLAAAVGAGAIEPGDVLDSCGTAEALVAAVEPPVPVEDVRRAVAGGVTVGWHAAAGRQVLLGGFESGRALQRFLDLLGIAEDERERLDEEALAVPPGAGGIVAEDVTGERAGVTGIPHGVAPAQAWRAALEGVVAHGAGVLATIESVLGPRRRLVLTGGGVCSRALLELKRLALGEFELPRVQEAGARGAALLAGVAAGAYGGVDGLPALPERQGAWA
jgi:sugar (pentulose or hexulose) kinase